MTSFPVGMYKLSRELLAVVVSEKSKKNHYVTAEADKDGSIMRKRHRISLNSHAFTGTRKKKIWSNV